MRFYLLLLLLPLTAPAAPRLGWRDVATHSRAARLLAVFHDLGAESFDRATPEHLRDRLAEALPALALDESEIARRLPLRLSVIERARLLERLPVLVDGLTAAEPYVRLSLQRRRRRLDPRANPRPWRATVRDYVRIALAKLRVVPGEFAIRNFRDAGIEADLILNLEAVVTEAARAPQVTLSPTDEALEFLVDFADLHFSPRQARYLNEVLNDVEDLDAFDRAYRRRLSVATRAGLAEALPSLSTLLYDFETPAVRREILRRRDERFVLTPEMALARGLKTELLRSFGSLLGRRGLTSAPARFAEVERVTARAVRWLHVERILRDGVEPTCTELLANAIAGAART